MGKTVKTALGVAVGGALIYFSGGIGSFLIGELGLAVTATGATLTFSAIQLAGALVLGNALKKNIGDVGIDGQGQILQTRKTNTAPVPIVYGENKLAGNIIWETTNNYSGGTTNKDYWAILAMSDGAATAFLELFANDELMDDKGNGTHTLEFIHVYPHLTTGDGIVVSDIDFAVDQAGTIVAGSTIFGTPQTPTVSSTGAGAAINLVDGGTASWTPTTIADEYIRFVDNVSAAVSQVKLYLYDKTYGEYSYSFKVQYSDDNVTYYDASTVYTNNEGDNFSWVTVAITESAAHLYWQVVFSDISFSSNPAPVLEIDFTSSVSISAAMPENISYLAVHQLYDATDSNQLKNITAIMQGRVIDYFSATTIAGQTFSASPAAIVYDIMKDRLGVTESGIDVPSFYEAQTFADTNLLNCHIVFAQQQNTDSAISAVLASMRGHIVFSNNKWVFLHDSTKTIDKALDESDVLEGSLSISMPSSSAIANKITVKFINPADEWQVATATIQNDTLISTDGQEVEQIVETRGVTNRFLADKIAVLTLNQMRYSEDSLGNRIFQTPLSIAFSTSIKNAELEVGDLVSLEHFLLNFTRKFNILSVETDQGGAIQLQCTEYCGTHYKDAADTAILT